MNSTNRKKNLNNYWGAIFDSQSHINISQRNGQLDVKLQGKAMIGLIQKILQ